LSLWYLLKDNYFESIFLFHKPISLWLQNVQVFVYNKYVFSSGSKTIFATGILSGKSFLHHKNKTGSKIDPCGTSFYFPK